jgi:hypothetical protein
MRQSCRNQKEQGTMAKIFKIEIKCDNDAFGECDYDASRELANILRGLADKLTSNPELCLYPNSAQWLRDSNGNRVGTYKYEDRDRIRLGR